MQITAFNANGQPVPVPTALPLGMVAYYFANRSRKVLVMAKGPSIAGERIEIAVSGKREAATICDGAHARRWNF